MAGLLLNNKFIWLQRERVYGLTESRPRVPAFTSRYRGKALKISNRIVEVRTKTQAGRCQTTVQKFYRLILQYPLFHGASQAFIWQLRCQALNSP
jgi:hypothetical protein